MTEHPQTDRIMAGLRERLESISTNVANSAERCRAFKNTETAAYAAWLVQHRENGCVLHRTAATAKAATLHTAGCPVIAVSDDAPLVKGPKLGAPSKAAALAFALHSKWKVLTTCDQCTP